MINNHHQPAITTPLSWIVVIQLRMNDQPGSGPLPFGNTTGRTHKPLCQGNPGGDSLTFTDFRNSNRRQREKNGNDCHHGEQLDKTEAFRTDAGSGCCP